MKKLLFLLILMFVIFKLWAQPLPAKYTHSIIIDTDCAVDDYRAICILLSRPEITVKAIVSSDGSLAPAEGERNIRNLLHMFKKDTIPVAQGEILKGMNPPWRLFNKQINWGNNFPFTEHNIKADFLVWDNLIKSNEKVIVVCLGSLTNIYKVLKKDELVKSKIEKIVWYNESIKPFEGFNYECDKVAAEYVFNAGIRIDVISNQNKEEAKIDTSYLWESKEADNILAGCFSYLYSQPVVYEKLVQGHFYLCDDLLAIYITNPELFDMNNVLSSPNIRYNQDYDVESVREALMDMIKGKYFAQKNIVFNEFPKDRSMFSYDVRQIMDSAISRYGLDEWKANVMTDEFHGHLGVFSIVGAKMGIRAREIFGVSADQLTVLSFAGSKPPYSCLTDGIQVSTGATLGMGTISLATGIRKPGAVFTYKGRSVDITLKSEYLKMVDDDISEGILKFGLMDDGYWKMVRRNALKYWLEWDRNEIFDCVELEKK